MSRLRPRRGAGLAELIVALTLSAIVSAAGAAALRSTERYMRRSRAESDARRTVREAESVLASDLRSVPSDSVQVRGDTAVDFLGAVGVSVVCVASGNTLVLPPDVAAGGLPYSAWRATPEAGDIVAAFDTTGAGSWRMAVVDSAGTRADGAGCTPSSGLMSAADSAARRPVMRMFVHAVSAPVIAAVGAPVRVLRGGRYALTHSADGSWSLSYRRCTSSACGTAQPVVGPLAAPSDSGLVFTNVPGESRIEVALRPLAPDPPARGEPGLLRVTMRNRAAGSP